MPVSNRGTTKRPRWHYDFTINGRRYREAIPEARTKLEAEQAEAQIKAGIFQRRYGERVKRRDLTFAEFVNKTYLPWAVINKRSYECDVRACAVLCERFGRQPIAEIARHDVDAFKVERQESVTVHGTVRAPASVNRELEILSKIFTLAEDDRVIDHNPARRLKKLYVDNSRTKYLTVNDEELLLAACTGRRAHLADILRVAIDTGMRRSELVRLRRDWVNFDLGIVTVNKSKTGSKGDRPVPMTGRVRGILRRRCEAAGPDGYLFKHPRYGGKNKGAHISDFKTALTSACVAAGVARITAHTLRHTFGTRLGDSGVPIERIAELMGHTSISTTRRYVHTTHQAKRDAVTLLTTYREQKKKKKPARGRKKERAA